MDQVTTTHSHKPRTLLTLGLPSNNRCLGLIVFLAACSSRTNPTDTAVSRLDAGSSSAAALIADAEAHLASGCSDGAEIADAPRLQAPILLGACPEGSEPTQGKVWHAKYLEQHPGETQIVAIVLKEGGLPEPCSPEGDCPAGADWETRSRLNVQQVTCVLDRITDGGDVAGLGGFWYDRPQVEAGPALAPVGRIFRLTLSWDQVWTAASHPYVARVEPVPGAEEQWHGGEPPPAPCDCPALTDQAEPKLAGLGATTDASDVLQLAIHLRPLPDADPRLQDTAPSEFASAERAISSTRQVFCVRRALDQILAVPPEPGPLAIAMLLPGASLPPFGDPLATQQAFSVSITRQEATELAKHPYIDHLELLTDTGSKREPPGCPPDLDAPLVEPQCTDEPESPSGKISAVLLQAHANACAEPYGVAVSVRGGATYCRLPECPGAPTPCPERDLWEQRWRDENHASQTCVRQVLNTLGAVVEDEASLTNTLYTHLDWQQLEMLAAQPDVLQIDENEAPCGAAIPPP